MTWTPKPPKLVIPSRPAFAPQVRIARTVSASGSYPAPQATSHIVFPIVFLDGSFTETAGAQTPTLVERSATPQAFAYHLPGGYLWEDTDVAVVCDRGKWWILDRSIYLVGTMDAALSLGGSATLSVYDEDSWTDTTWDLTVYASRLGAVASDKKALAEWSVRRQKWIAKVWEC